MAIQRAIAGTDGRPLTGARSNQWNKMNTRSSVVAQAGLGEAQSAVEPVVLYGVKMLPPEFSSLFLDNEVAQETKLIMLAFLLSLPSAMTLLVYALVSEPSVSAREANELLRQGSAFLVDVRSAEERSASGVPDLRRAARGRASVAELTPLPRNEKKALKNPASVERRLAAAEALEGVRNTEGIVVMGADRDTSTNEAKRVAQEIRSLSPAAARRGVAIMDGGFRAWEQAGLQVCASYNSNPAVDFAVDTAEAAREQPAQSARYLGISLGVALFVVNAKPIMIASGFWGLFATAVDLLSYRIAAVNDSAAGALTDFRRSNNGRSQPAAVSKRLPSEQKQ